MYVYECVYVYVYVNYYCAFVAIITSLHSYLLCTAVDTGLWLLVDRKLALTTPPASTPTSDVIQRIPRPRTLTERGRGGIVIN